MARRTMKCYQYEARNLKKYVKREAKFAPQLLADGLSYGVSSSQGNLVHGMFDDVGSNKVDPFSDIMSDKFELMNDGIKPAQVDVSEPDSTTV